MSLFPDIRKPRRGPRLPRPPGACWLYLITAVAWGQSSLTFDTIDVQKVEKDSGATITYQMNGSVLEYQLTTVTTTVGQRTGSGTFTIERSLNQWFDRGQSIAFAPPAAFHVAQTVRDISSPSVTVFREEAQPCISSFLNFDCDIGRMTVAPGPPRRAYLDVELRVSIVSSATLTLRVYFRLDTVQPCGAVVFDHMEAVQTIQASDPAARIPLIYGKPTVARVFLRFASPPQPTLSGVNGTLRAFRQGVEIAGSPLSPFSGSMRVEDPVKRDDLSHSLNFELPPGWLEPGELEMEAEAVLPPCADRTDPLRLTHRETVSFLDARPDGRTTLRLAWSPICYASPRVNCANPAIVPSHMELARKVLPIAPDNLQFVRLPVPVRTLNDPIITGTQADDFLATMMKEDFAGEGRFHDNLVAVMPNAVSGGLHGNSNAIPGRAVMVWQSASDIPAVLAHELGHIYGRRHTNHKVCTGSPIVDEDGSNDLFTDWPYPTADAQEIGFDVEKRQITRANFGDLISYCYQQGVSAWVSPYTYTKLMQGRLQGALHSGEPSAVRLASAGARPAEVGPRAIVSGRVNQDGSGALDPVYQVRSGADVPVSESGGSHCLRLFGADGGVLGEHCFTPNLTNVETGGPVEYKRFVWKLAWPDGTARLALVAGDRTLAELAAGAPPELRITSPSAGEQWDGGARELAWSGSDPAGGTLVYSVLYSPDAGTTWHPLAMDLQATSLTVDPASIQGGASVLFRVIASSGLSSTTADTGPINVVQRPSIKPSTQTVDFEGRNGKAATQSFVLANPGTGPLTVSAFRIDNDQFRVVSPAAPLLVPAGEEVSVAVRWRVDTTGAQTGRLIIASDDAAQPEVEIQLRGSVTPEGVPAIAVEPAALDFGEVASGQTKELTLALRNTGSVALTVSGAQFSDPRFRAAGATFPITVAPDESSAFKVQFAPTAAGPVQGTVTFSTSDPAHPSVEVRLTGTGSAGPGGPLCAAPLAGLVSWWPGDGNANDATGGNNGTVETGASFGTGQSGQAFQFGGSGYVQIGNPANLQITNAVTIEGWVNPRSLRAQTAGPPMGAILTKWAQVFTDIPDSDAYGLWLIQSGETVSLFSAIHQPGPNEPTIQGGTVPLNTWTHVAMTFDGTTGAYSLYVNGQAVASLTSVGPILATSHNVQIGREDSYIGRIFDGSIDELAVYNRALAPSEIQTIFASGAAGKCKSGTPPAGVGGRRGVLGL